MIAVIGAFLLARQGDSFLARNSRATDVVTTASGLQYKVLTAGKGGPKPTDSDVALVNYEGKLLNGTTFDKSQQPTPMPVAAADEKTGRQGVVPGFSEALKLMSKGAKYRFWIKPSLAYGSKAAGPIPANSVLVFDLELLDFLPESVIRQMQAQQQQMQGTIPPGAGGIPGAGAIPGGPPPGQ
jgi:FKBP-type peptidyl-prolyl cis-trans isomerase